MGPNGSRRKSWSSPATMTRAPPSARASAASTTARSKNCTSSIPTTSDERARATSSAHPSTGMADDIGRVVAVVDARLEEDHALTRDLRAPEAPDHLLALAGEHRAADDLEPSSSVRRHPDHGGDARRAGGRAENALRAAKVRRVPAGLWCG